MRVLLSLLLVSLLVVTACGGDASRDALYNEEVWQLNRDLDLVLAERRAQDAEFELRDGQPAEAATFAQTPEPRPQPVSQPRPAPVRSQPAPQRAPQPRVVTQTNVKRDAAIGAGVGAAAGAVIHRPNRWKGAVIGAAVGGAAGAVVGATIDKKTTVVYD